MERSWVWILELDAVWDILNINLLFFYKNGPNPASFSFIFGLFHLFSVFFKYMWKMSIQYTAPGFEPTTFGTWVSFHNH